MANSDPSTPRVNLFVRNSDLVDGIESLRSKRFVDLTIIGESRVRQFRG